MSDIKARGAATFPAIPCRSPYQCGSCMKLFFALSKNVWTTDDKQLCVCTVCSDVNELPYWHWPVLGTAPEVNPPA